MQQLRTMEEGIRESLSRLHLSEEKFIEEYKEFCRGKNETKSFLIEVLGQLQKAVTIGDLDHFKNLCKVIRYVNAVDKDVTLIQAEDNPFSGTNLIILTCKYSRNEILTYIFENTEILKCLTTKLIHPYEEDEYCHNAFYYAIRSENVKLLDTLVNRWPDNYFTTNFEKLDEILSTAYGELKLKNVPLSPDIEIFVESLLIDLRFSSENSKQTQSIKSSTNNVKERIKCVLENISLLQREYLYLEVDEKFLYLVKFIAQNIYILKQQMKSTYEKIPWEEVEFLLVIFVLSHTDQNNFQIYQTIINKRKLLNYLGYFSKILSDMRNRIEGRIKETVDLSKMKRGKVIANIISNFPELEELYSDYQQIRDMHSLEKITKYIKLARSANIKDKDDFFIIVRTLHVIGENIKNTLESPKLSNNTSEMIIEQLLKNIKSIILDIRNSYLHPPLLTNRIESEVNRNVNFLAEFRKSMDQISKYIKDNLYRNKVKIIRKILKEIINSGNVSEIIKLINVFNNINVDDIMFISYNSLQIEEFELLMLILKNNVQNRTIHEGRLFQKIWDIIHFEKIKTVRIRKDYNIAFMALYSLKSVANDNIDNNDIRKIKIFANLLLESISSEMNLSSLEKIANLIIMISNGIPLRCNNLDKVYGPICKIFATLEFQFENVNYVHQLREKLTTNLKILKDKQINVETISKEKYNTLLNLKLCKLKGFLHTHSTRNESTDLYFVFRKEEKLQAVLEMLLLDITSILDKLNCLQNSIFCLDNDTPLLTGKCLLNYLVHDSLIFELCNPVNAVFLNAKKFATEHTLRNKKIGKSVEDNPSNMKIKYERSLDIINAQKKMFVALENGDLQTLNCLKRGVDIKARSYNLWTTLHFAASGSNLQVIKFIHENISKTDNNYVNMKDSNGQSPIHISALHGREYNIEYFLKEMFLYVDEIDSSGKTPLHIAAENGKRNSVDILLKNNANPLIQDNTDLIPMHYAIRNNHIDTVKILLATYVDFDINEADVKLHTLYVAAECGNLELVDSLVHQGARVNSRTERDWTPLHVATFNGRFDITHFLITKGADIDARVVEGSTPLHYAIENGSEIIASTLVRCKANLNLVDNIFNNTPLHYAAANGHKEIVKILLQFGADAKILTSECMSPLHLAAQGGYLGIVELLISYNVEIDVKNKYHFTPLHFASINGHKDVAEFLIKNKSNLNSISDSGLVPLHLAAMEGHTDIVDLLIQNGAVVDVQDIKGNTPLHLAAMNSKLEVVNMLLKHKARVDIKTNGGFTPLHSAASSGCRKVVDRLIRNNATVNVRDYYGIIPLHAAVLEGHKDVTRLLIKNSDINTEDSLNITPLHIAVEFSHNEVVKILVENGANVNMKLMLPLESAIVLNNLEIVKYLLANGSKITESMFSHAIFIGNVVIAELLFKNKSFVKVDKIKCGSNITPLHLAALAGRKDMINYLISRGANVNVTDEFNLTPLHSACRNTCKEIVEILIKKGANVNANSCDGTPLHIASKISDNIDIVEILLSSGADVNIKDKDNRTPLEVAVENGDLEIAKKLFLLTRKIHSKSNGDYTILHVAAESGHLDIVKYLVSEGCDINSRNISGVKPIHVAAREDHKYVVEFLHKRGCSVNEVDNLDQTLLHFCADEGKMNVTEYLILEGADINAVDKAGFTPLHSAVGQNHKDVVDILLENGAIYNALTYDFRRPVSMTENEEIIKLLVNTDKLFVAVKHNNILEIERCIKEGAYINARNTDNYTLLHYATWKGQRKITNILLKNNANPNVICGGSTPLHYAAECNYLGIVKDLLSNRAIYNALNENDKTPIDLTDNENIIQLLNQVNDCFKDIQFNKCRIISVLENIEDIDIIKAIMNTRNRANKSLIEVAMDNNFSKIERLKELSQDDVFKKLEKVTSLLNKCDYQSALTIANELFEKRKKILGPLHPGTLYIQTYLAHVYYAQGSYSLALEIYQKVFKIQEVKFGLNNVNTIMTKGFIAKVKYSEKKYEEALSIYQDLYKISKKILNPHDPRTLNIRLQLVSALIKQRMYEEALYHSEEILKIRKKFPEAKDLVSLSVQDSKAVMLNKLDKYEEAIKLLEENFEKKKAILGVAHADTIRTQYLIAKVAFNQEKFRKALKAFVEIFNMQEKVLGLYNYSTIKTELRMAYTLFALGNWLTALKLYGKNLKIVTNIYGKDHPAVLNINQKMHVISVRFKVDDIFLKDVNIVASTGDINTLQQFLNKRNFINHIDVDGRTPLCYAVDGRQLQTANILLKSGADATKITHNGSTSLHIAAHKGYKDMIEILLKSVSNEKLSNFVNAKTISSNTTALHVAARKGFFEIVKYLLGHGANYNPENRGGKTPLDIAKDHLIIKLLTLIDDLFRKAKDGNAEILCKLKMLPYDEFIAVTNTRNNQGNTLLQIAITNKHKNIVAEMLKLLKQGLAGR